MDALLPILRWVHIVAGFAALAAFWVPVFAAKGGGMHRGFGRIFKYCAYLVLGAAGLSILIHLVEATRRGIGPAEAPDDFAFLVFLGYLTLVTFVGLRHGLQVLEHKSGLEAMNRPLDRALAHLSMASSLILVGYAWYFSPPMQVILYALSPIGFFGGRDILNAIRGRRPERKAWFYEHMGAMLGTGVAFHTAFAVFGAAGLFDLQLAGFARVIPWVLPALVGIPAVAIWTRYYRRRFGDLPA